MSISEPGATLRVIMYSAMPFEVSAFKDELRKTPDARFLHVIYVSARLDKSTVSLAQGSRAVCLFPRDEADGRILTRLREEGVELVALRYAGVSSVDIEKADELGIKVTRTPAHAPTSIAEYTIALMLALTRKIHVASNRVRDGNLSMYGLIGFDMSEKTVGIIGTGKVGRIVARILKGFGCKLLVYDMEEAKEMKDLGARYVSLKDLLADADILTLHAPLVPGTHHMIGYKTLPRCKQGVHIINTARGGLLDAKAVIEGLRSGQVGGLAMDVYEGESGFFFEDNTGEVIDFDFQVLNSMPNVLITGRQSALTTNAQEAVARATVKTLLEFQRGEELEYKYMPG